MKRLLSLVCCFWLPVAILWATERWCWYTGEGVPTVRLHTNVDPVVRTALSMLTDDLEQVTGNRLQRRPKTSPTAATIEVVQLDRLKPAQREAWRQRGVCVDSLLTHAEAFCLMAEPQKETGRAHLLCVGSDGRGTAYGLLEVSRLAGVSPWVWWGDSKPRPQHTLSVDSGYHTWQHPSVALRGIFINDEDWSLRPWASQTHHPSGAGVISAETYKEVFRLLLRLRGNMIWPAMHDGTVAFYRTPHAADWADSCGIYVGTSHCEPLMRNNVDEWDVATRGRYNYLTNKSSVQAYWRERLRETYKRACVYTLGMRGIHDGSMEGVRTLEQRVTALQSVIDDQREMLQREVARPSHRALTSIPQVFVPYKEVLAILEAGLRVPDDVTLLWCDDNYGYLTRLPDATQQRRSGGSGLYYHLSYWGRPMDYLWLNSTQPGLVYYSLLSAYQHQARREWIVNVHDPKTAGYTLELFLDMAWHIDDFLPHASVADTLRRLSPLRAHLQNYLTREWGITAGEALLPVMERYYALTAVRRPEHMGWNQVELNRTRWYRGRSSVANSTYSREEARRMLAAYRQLRAKVQQLQASVIDEAQQASFFAAVAYPLQAASLMAEKMLSAEEARLMADGSTGERRTHNDTLIAQASARSLTAYHAIHRLTRFYNDTLSAGRWHLLMNDAPRDLYQYWAPVTPLSPTEEECARWLTPAVREATERADAMALQYTPQCRAAASFAEASAPVDLIDYLGHSQQAVSVEKGEHVTYTFESEDDSTRLTLTVALVPTQPVDSCDLRFAVSLDGGDTLRSFSLKEPFRSERWKENVMSGQTHRSLTLPRLAAGRHTLTLHALDEGIVFDQWYIGKKKTRHQYLLP